MPGDNTNEYLKDGIQLAQRCVTAYMAGDAEVLHTEVVEEKDPRVIQAGLIYLATAYGKMIKASVESPEEVWSKFLLTSAQEEFE